MPEYPECEKMSTVRDKSQAIGEFLEWLAYEKGVYFWTTNTWHEEFTCPCMDYGDDQRDVHDEAAWCEKCQNTGKYIDVQSEDGPFQYQIEKILAEFFEIDLDKVEAERRQMLAELQNMQDAV